MGFHSLETSLFAIKLYEFSTGKKLIPPIPKREVSIVINKNFAKEKHQKSLRK